MSDDPFDEYDYNPALKHLEEGWDINPRRPPSQISRLWKLVKRHFPEFELDTRIKRKLVTMTAEDWVAECDDTITFQCSQLATISNEFDTESFEGFSVFQHKRSIAKTLRQKLKAIETRDPSLWRRAQNNTDARMRDLENEAAELLGSEGESISDVMNLTTGPVDFDDQTKAHFWAKKYDVISLALKNISGGGRPNSSYKDEAVRAIVSLWETFSGKDAAQPSHDAGCSDRESAMVIFVAEAAEVYAEFGMKGAVSSSSGAFWKRILS